MAKYDISPCFGNDLATCMSWVKAPENFCSFLATKRGKRNKAVHDAHSCHLTAKSIGSS